MTPCLTVPPFMRFVSSRTTQISSLGWECAYLSAGSEVLSVVHDDYFEQATRFERMEVLKRFVKHGHHLKTVQGPLLLRVSF